MAGGSKEKGPGPRVQESGGQKKCVQGLVGINKWKSGRVGKKGWRVEKSKVDGKKERAEGYSERRKG